MVIYAYNHGTCDVESEKWLLCEVVSGFHGRSHTPSWPPEILILEGADNNFRAILLCVLRFTKRKEIDTPRGRKGGDNKVDVTSGWLALQRHKRLTTGPTLRALVNIQDSKGKAILESNLEYLSGF